jgi:hypothetical protein
LDGNFSLWLFADLMNLSSGAHQAWSRILTSKAKCSEQMPLRIKTHQPGVWFADRQPQRIVAEK